VIDGEVVADESGWPSFNLLRNYGSAGAPLIYYVFDLLVLEGRNLMSEPLVRRREILRQNVLAKFGEPIRESPVLNASLRDLMTAVRAQGLEGLVAKRLDTDDHVSPASVHHCIADASTTVGHNRTGPTPS
jgi:bifunctional non-homologous end joining protein LigD